MTAQSDTRAHREAGAPANDRPPAWPRLIAFALIGAVLGGLLAALFGPTPMGLKGDSGDPALAARVRRAIGDDRGYKSLSVAEVTKTGATYAGLGVPDDAHEPITPTTRYPLGSITKTFDAMLLADAVQRGEVQLDQRVETLLPELQGSEVGSVSLAELASHRAGVPPMLASEALGGFVFNLTLSDPYSADETKLLNEVRTYKLSKRGEVHYSNNGAALLGHALARAIGQPSWEALVSARILQPLGMTNTVIAGTDDLLPADRVAEWTHNGHRTQSWTSRAHAPAGSSTWTTAEDMARYAQAILSGTAPGMSALDPRWGTDDADRIGLHWFTRDVNGHAITWHNGGLGGARTMLTLDRDQGKAMVVLGNSGRSVDQLGLELVSGKDYPVRSTLNVIGLVTVALWMVFVGLFVRSVLRGNTRAQLLNRGIDAAWMTIFADRLGPWELIPGWVLGVGAGVFAAAAVVGVLRARGLPWTRGKPRATWMELGVSAAVLLLIAGLALFG